jgi:phosphoribosylformylglycinamidine (FGAM) synthase-like amidotransferase family enzyme
MATKVKALILRAPGTNCDVETAFAFKQVGAQADLVHVGELINHLTSLSNYQIMVIPGGFTYGDDISAGKILANELRLKLRDEIKTFVDDGRLILGICNGFQALVKAGMLPESRNENTQPLTIAGNDSGKFECRWIYLQANKTSPCVFTKGTDLMYLPVAHGEGKVVVEPGVLEELNVALHYADETGNIQADYPTTPTVQ